MTSLTDTLSPGRNRFAVAAVIVAVLVGVAIIGQAAWHALGNAKHMPLEALRRETMASYRPPLATELIESKSQDVRLSLRAPQTAQMRQTWLVRRRDVAAAFTQARRDARHSGWTFAPVHHAEAARLEHDAAHPRSAVDGTKIVGGSSRAAMTVAVLDWSYGHPYRAGFAQLQVTLRWG